MDHCLTINRIAEVLNLNPRMIRMRAKKERWYTVCQRVRGGYRYLFPCATLPDDVSAAVYTSPSTSAAAGFSRGMGVNAEIRSTKQLRQKAKEAGLAAYNTLPEDKKAKADARFEILQARDAFLSATHLSKKKGTLAEHNKSDLFKGKRSRELDFGSLGYRRSKEIKPKARMTWKMVLGAIKQFKFNTALRKTESVNKEELHTWPDERLDVIGCRRVEKDTFWYEIDVQKIADNAR